MKRAWPVKSDHAAAPPSPPPAGDLAVNPVAAGLCPHGYGKANPVNSWNEGWLPVKSIIVKLLAVPHGRRLYCSTEALVTLDPIVRRCAGQ